MVAKRTANAFSEEISMASASIQQAPLAQTALAVALFIVPLAGAQTPPYPSSRVIREIKWHPDTVKTFGRGSDQWPMTWADDGNVYAAWGDGNGFANHLKRKQYLGVTRIKGMPPKLSGDDLWGIPVQKGEPNAKPQALIAYDGKIHMFFNTSQQKWKESVFAWTSDNGATWKIARRPAFHGRNDGVHVKGICQFGKGYAGARDGYAYVYLAENYSPAIWLGRVSKDHLGDRSKYTYFKGMDASGNAKWTSDFAAKQPVFRDPGKMIWHLSVSYNAGLNRYLLSKPHFVEGDRKWQDVASLGIFDAPNPWGPWTTVTYEDNFVDSKAKFNYILPTKFMSKDGKTMWMAWSGWPEYDSVSFIKCTLKGKAANAPGDRVPGGARP